MSALPTKADMRLAVQKCPLMPLADIDPAELFGPLVGEVHQIPACKWLPAEGHAHDRPMLHHVDAVFTELAVLTEID